jgi:translation elongation factor EF-Tu-like GTPase
MTSKENQRDVLDRIRVKIELLADARNRHKAEAERLISENERLHLVNTELQRQLDEVRMNSENWKIDRSSQACSDSDNQELARQRIDELVKEIDSCINRLEV